MRKRWFSYVPAVLAALLLLACASRNEVCPTCIERTDERLMDAAASLYPDAVKRLLDEGADVNAKDQYGETPLMKALRQPPSHSLESMRPMRATVFVLLDAGADVRAVNKRGVDTLKLVQETGNLEIIQLFEDYFTKADQDRMFMRALADRQFDVAFYLLDAGANPVQVNEKNQSALHLAVNSPLPHPELVSLLLKSNDANRMDDDGKTPIMIACANGAPVEIVRLLFDGSAKISSRFDRKSLLFLAVTAQKENAGLLRYLLDHGFDANETSPDGIPLLVLAVRADRIQSARALLDGGADPAVLDQYGETAYRQRLASP